ncbi:MAG: serine 3-dehydrogenase [Bacteroidota bacterium]|jgi:NADP-dependent 3-hydroxy acid dehydrogenase YdfG
MSKTIFITGATSGFGKAIAYTFASHNWRLILTGRRQDRLDSIANELREQYGVDVLTLCFDVSEREETLRQLNALPHDWQAIDVLVNNAGLAAGLASFQEGVFDDWDRMIDTNIKGLLNVTRALVDGMIGRKQGHIINIGSIAGSWTYPKGNVYSATKAAVDSLSQGMRIDLLPYGIKVTNICPGAAETEFSLVRFQGDASRAAAVYEGYEPLQAQDIADLVYFAATRPSHVVLNDITVTPLAQANPANWHKNTR